MNKCDFLVSVCFSFSLCLCLPVSLLDLFSVSSSFILHPCAPLSPICFLVSHCFCFPLYSQPLCVSVSLHMSLQVCCLTCSASLSLFLCFSFSISLCLSFILSFTQCPCLSHFFVLVGQASTHMHPHLSPSPYPSHTEPLINAFQHTPSHPACRSCSFQSGMNSC